jgi:hypothetical protein
MRKDMDLQGWIDNKISEIAKQLTILLRDNPDSFKCGIAFGYKQALLDLHVFLEDRITE